MFGLIVAGRRVNYEFHQVAPDKIVFTIPNADNINHLVIFLNDFLPLSPTTNAPLAAQIYFSYAQSPNWSLLGHLSNDKPSAIYKISNLKKGTELSNLQSPLFGTGAGVLTHEAQVGISLEPLEIAIQSTPVEAIATTKANFADFAKKMLDNFVNYAMSFPNGTVTMQMLQNWYETFSRRLDNDPYFWR